MIIEEIKLKSFRNYDSLTLRPHPGVNILFGPNGVGKTNLLEAVHYCALGRSHRTGQDREAVMKDRPAGAIGITLRRSEGRHEIALKLTPEEARKKQIFIDRKKGSRLSGLMGQLQVVIFSPEDLLLVKEGPALRRRFLDMLLSQLSTGYFVALQQYQKALEQRNTLIREGRKTGSCSPAMLDSFEQAMAGPAEAIIRSRRWAAEQLSSLAAEKYRVVSGRDEETFGITYRCCLEEQELTAQRFLESLRASRQQDLFRGTTCFGPHREDLLFTLKDREMKLFASQGQIRTAALSLKLSQMALFRQKTGESPVLLLDDVMSELDMSRRTRLLQEIGTVQTFITCTDESDLEGCREKRSYRVTTDEQGFAAIREISSGEAAEEEKWEDLDFLT